MNPTLTVGVDIGGTKIAAGVVDERGRVLARGRVDSPADSADALVAAICALVVELVGEAEVAAVGLSVAGFVDIDAGVVVTAPNLAWRDLPLRDIVHQRIGLPVVVENDGNAAAWGERVFGAGRGVNEMVLVSVGTGIGGGIITGGTLRHGAHGMAAEIGHLTFVPGGEPCGCGRRGCWERYASGPALERLAAEVFGLSPRSSSGVAPLRSSSGVAPLRSSSGAAPSRSSSAAEERGRVSRRPDPADPADTPPRSSSAAEERGRVSRRPGPADSTAPAHPTGPELLALANAGDPTARALVTTLGERLGHGIATLVAVLDPAVVVLGGGVAAAGDLLLTPARETLLADLPGGTARPAPEIVLASLGNDAGTIGAAHLASLTVRGAA